MASDRSPTDPVSQAASDFSRMVATAAANDISMKRTSKRCWAAGSVAGEAVISPRTSQIEPPSVYRTASRAALPGTSQEVLRQA